MKPSKFLFSFFLVFLVVSGALVLAFSEEEVETPFVTHTSTTDTTCLDGKCNLILYSGVRNVYEDAEWKRVEDARSLKDAWVKTYLEKDPDFDIEILEVNYTDLSLNLVFNPLDYTIDELKQKYPECTESKENDIKCDFKLDVKEEVCNETDCWKESIKFQYKYQLKNGELKTDMKYHYKGNALDRTFKFGGNSTTIQLQDADTENLKDSDVGEYAPNTNTGADSSLLAQPGTQEWRIYITFNLSSISSSQTIDDATLRFYMNDGTDNGYASVYHIYNNWINGTGSNVLNETQITWNNQPCGTDFDKSTNCNLTYTQNTTHPQFGDLLFNVTNIVDIDKDNENVSFVIRADSYTPSKSKEYATVSQRPYLNITYTEGVGDISPHLYLSDQHFMLKNKHFILKGV